MTLNWHRAGTFQDPARRRNFCAAALEIAGSATPELQSTLPGLGGTLLGSPRAAGLEAGAVDEDVGEGGRSIELASDGRFDILNGKITRGRL
jgi:hypothetical protein